MSSRKEERPPLTPEEIRRRTFERAVKLLAAKPRSIAELRERLLEKRFTNSSVVELVIERLKEYGYLSTMSALLSAMLQRKLARSRLEKDGWRAT
jgi:SOS response regulatory protein OraA/RecX